MRGSDRDVSPLAKPLDRQDWALLWLLSLLWGGAFFFAGVAVKELPPLTCVLVRVALAAMTLCVSVPQRRGSDAAFRGGSAMLRSVDE